MIIVTGGAGFIGSALVWALNCRGETDILVVDEVDSDEKERNLGPLQYEKLVGIKEFREQLLSGEYNDKGVQAILHMGACSDTSETDWDYLEDNNVEYSKDVIRWCFDNDVRCIYASSAATYGDGSNEYNDNHEIFDQLRPLNLYGKSKLLVDVWARDGEYLNKVVGLRFFNVYGPNEEHKGSMRSLVSKSFKKVKDENVIELFKSCNKEYGDGEQQRDFIYIKDVVDVVLYFMDNKDINGVFNVGTGIARSWNDLAKAMFEALNKELNIRHIDMPEKLKKQYQYFTKADITKLRKVGYKKEFVSLEDAIDDYVNKYLLLDLRLGE